LKTHRLSLLDRLIILAAVPLIHLLGLTLRIRSEGRSEWGPRARPSPVPLWALWHETILMSVWYHRRRNVHVMISASRDGELVTAVGRFFGYTAVRGSSSRGGQEAVREMVEYLRAGKPGAITPDGPRGPRREMKMGAVQIARLSGCPVVPFGFAAERFWRLKSWDRFIIPKPFSRAVFVYGEPIQVPPGEDTDREYFDKIKAELDRVTAAAESFFPGKN
jgi:lysophospholipid acyltransferase (LPLAT)-like uncharacterized protein